MTDDQRGGKVLPTLSRILRKVLSILQFGCLLLRMAGPRVFLKQLKNQVCRRTVFIEMLWEYNDDKSIMVPEGICDTRFATSEEIEEFFHKTNQESPGGRYEMLVRRRFYESGFHRVLIAWTADTHEMCNIRWLVTAQDTRGTGFEERLPSLGEDEALLENTYTLEKFRKRGIQKVSSNQSINLVRKLGYRRFISQVAEDNTPSLKSNRGGLMFAKVLERHFLFRVKRTTLETFDPPIPVHVPGENGGSGA